MKSSNSTRIRITAQLLAIAAALGLSGLVAAPAQAYYGNCVGMTYSDWTVAGAWVCFEPEGERLKICDTYPDGHHASPDVHATPKNANAMTTAIGGTEARMSWPFRR